MKLKPRPKQITNIAKHRFHGLRGKAYAIARKKLFQELKKEITTDYWELAAANPDGKAKVKDIGTLCNKHLIPVTVMCDWLYDLGLSKTDWEGWRDRGLKAQKIGVKWSN